MLCLNRVTLLGYAVSEPLWRDQTNGRFVQFLLETYTWSRQDNGERTKRTTRHRIIVKNAVLSEIAGEHLRKGDPVYVEGALQYYEPDATTQGSRLVEVVLGPSNSKLILLAVPAESAPA